MIRIYFKSDYKQVKLDSPQSIELKDDILWIDLHKANHNEISLVENQFGIKFPTKSQQEEIETSSRFTESNGTVIINSTFLTMSSTFKMEENDISFIVTKNILFTLRNFDSKVIADSVRKIKLIKNQEYTPVACLINIFSTRIDFDADMIESISKNIAALNRQLNSSKNIDESIIIRINEHQEQIMMLREALFDKQRVVSSLTRIPEFFSTNETIFRIILKDVSSLIEHTNFNFTRLEYMQNNFLGLINIEQNKIIKLFTVASVIFMPPTLIASIYGMNFTVIPELNWKYGYLFSIGLMILSSLLTLYYFRKRKWL